MCRQHMLAFFLRHFKRTGSHDLREHAEVLSQEKLLEYAILQVDNSYDAELILSKAMQSVTRAYYEGKIQKSLLTYTLSTIKHEATKARIKNDNRIIAEQRYWQENEIQHDAARNDSGQELEDIHFYLRRAIRELDDELSAIIYLHIWNELNFLSISKHLHIPEATVRNRYDNAIIELRTKLRTLHE